jgi:hypothetical protein
VQGKANISGDEVIRTGIFLKTVFLNCHCVRAGGSVDMDRSMELLALIEEERKRGREEEGKRRREEILILNHILGKLSSSEAIS